MEITKINSSPNNQQTFGHRKQVSKKDKLVSAGSFLGATIGVGTTLILIAKGKAKKTGQNLDLLKNNKKITLKNIKDWKLVKIGEYSPWDIISMATASLAGGLSAGLILDKNKENRKAKFAEGIIQMVGNIIFPIISVTGAVKLYDKIKSKINMPQFKAKKNIAKYANNIINSLPKVATSVVGLGTGIIIGNYIGNQINNAIFKKDENRKVKLTDFSAHLDDMALATYLLWPDNIVGKTACKFIPPALTMVGFEAGRKRAGDNAKDHHRIHGCHDC